MKKFLISSILLSVMALSACGDSTSSDESTDPCLDDPNAAGCAVESSETVTPEE